jgi:hypothetical protein
VRNINSCPSCMLWYWNRPVLSWWYYSMLAVSCGFFMPKHLCSPGSLFRWNLCPSWLEGLHCLPSRVLVPDNDSISFGMHRNNLLPWELDVVYDMPSGLRLP